MSTPRIIHFIVVLRILRYIKGTLGMSSPHGQPWFSLAILVPTWQKTLLTNRTTNYCFYLGDPLIS